MLRPCMGMKRHALASSPIPLRTDPDPGLAFRHEEEAVVKGYVAGLREAGWRGHARLVRLGYAATAPLRYGLATAGLLALTLRHQDGVGALERRRLQFIEQIVAQDAALVAYLLDLADEARMVIADL